jgi:hypothetical protein
MARTQRWQEGQVKDGVSSVGLSNWKYFHDYVRQEMLEYSHYIWRGQRESQWTLESTLDRLQRGMSQKLRTSLAQTHLNRFKLAIRGRRGSHPSKIENNNEWWALGQHQGLATPLLDWTESPFVALYFAFENPLRPQTGQRSVWALSGALWPKIKEISEKHLSTNPQPTTPPPILEYIRPPQDENARLVSQAGLFTRVPLGDTVDDWVRKAFAGDNEISHLIKISISEKGRLDCLRTLNKMNINHLTLFPDVYGASEHCNKSLQIVRY